MNRFCSSMGLRTVQSSWFMGLIKSLPGPQGRENYNMRTKFPPMTLTDIHNVRHDKSQPRTTMSKVHWTFINIDT